MLAGPMFGREFWVTVVDEFERSALTQERFARRRFQCHERAAV